MKSQYRENVLGGGRDLNRMTKAEMIRATSLPRMIAAKGTGEKRYWRREGGVRTRVFCCLRTEALEHVMLTWHQSTFR